MTFACSPGPVLNAGPNNEEPLMAKDEGGLFSLERKGTVGNAITFTSYKGKSYVRIQSKRKQPKSFRQIANRSLLTFIAQSWSIIPDFGKETWTADARADNITPLNAQIRDAQNRQKRQLGWRREKVGAFQTPRKPTSPNAISAFRSIVFSWTRPFIVFQGQYSSAIYLKHSADVEGVFQELRLIVPPTTTSVQILDLPSGQEVFLRVRETQPQGLLGDLSDVVSITVE